MLLLSMKSINNLVLILVKFMFLCDSTVLRNFSNNVHFTLLFTLNFFKYIIIMLEKPFIYVIDIALIYISILMFVYKSRYLSLTHV